MASFLRKRSKSRDSQKSSREQSPERNEGAQQNEHQFHQFNERYGEEEIIRNGTFQNRNDHDTASLLTVEHHDILGRNPLSQVMGQVLGALNQLMADGKLKNTEYFNIGEFASKVKDCNYSEQKEKRAMQTELNKCVSEEISTYKKAQYDREINFHTLNPLLRCPQDFSPHDTLNSSEKKSNLFKVLPFGKSKFSGKNDSVTISEFLLNLNFIQKRYNLSLTEFTQALQFSTTGPTFEIVSQAIESGEPLSSIYNRLMVMYDSSISPFDARTLLHQYKANKNQNMMQLSTDIHRLANISSKMTQDIALRKQNCDSESCQAFIHALPTDSKNLALNQYNILTQKLGQPPDFIQFILYLNPYQPSIEADIQKYGDTKNNKFNRQSDRNNSQSYSRSIYSINSRNDYNSKNTSNFKTSPFRDNSYQGNRKNSPTFMNRRRCSLCNNTNHSASDGCYRMKDSNGRVVNITPVQQACTYCETNHNQRLFHPIKFCFRKNANSKSNRNNKNS